MAFPLLGAFITFSIGPIVRNVLLVLGLGTITYVGLQIAFETASKPVILPFEMTSNTK